MSFPHRGPACHAPIRTQQRYPPISESASIDITFDGPGRSRDHAAIHLAPPPIVHFRNRNRSGRYAFHDRHMAVIGIVRRHDDRSLRGTLSRLVSHRSRIEKPRTGIAAPRDVPLLRHIPGTVPVREPMAAPGLPIKLLVSAGNVGNRSGGSRRRVLPPRESGGILFLLREFLEPAGNDDGIADRYIPIRGQPIINDDLFPLSLVFRGDRIDGIAGSDDVRQPGYRQK